MIRRPMIAAVVGAAVAGFLFWHLFPGSHGAAVVSEVPAILPASGVNVNGQVVLMPLSTKPARGLSERVAIAKARQIVAHRYSATALETSFTLLSSSDVKDVPAWVVTFTSPKPTNVRIGGKKEFVTHFSAVLDATKGTYLGGFFTK